MQRDLSAAFLSAYDHGDLQQHSGVGYWMSRGLVAELGCIEHVGPLTMPRELLRRGRRFFVRSVRGQRYEPGYDPRVVAAFARQAERRLETLQPDFVISPDSTAVAQLDPRWPLVLWTDATFDLLVRTYPDYASVAEPTMRAAHEAQRRALHRADVLVFSSDWAAANAVERYGVDPDGIQLAAYGAGVEVAHSREQVAAMVEAREGGDCRLLFVGVDGHRKGADRAVAIARELQALGTPARLAMVGCGPPPESEPLPGLELYGYLDKARHDDLDRLSDLLARSDFLLLPSRADCTPLAVAEASAYGVPTLGADVGGVASSLSEGVNGHLLAPGASPREWAALLAELYGDRERYRALALSSFEEYERRLNWSTSAALVVGYVAELLEEREASRPAAA